MPVHRTLLARLMVDMHPDVIVIGREQCALRAVAAKFSLPGNVDEQRLHHFSLERHFSAPCCFCRLNR
jgi:hypothetical protein